MTPDCVQPRFEMKSLLLALVQLILASICWDCSKAQYHFNLDGEEYKFSFKTGDVGDHTREESRDTFGAVVGKYSYVDPNGNRREMRYRADENGFQPEGYAVHRVPVVDALLRLEVQVPEISHESLPEEPTGVAPLQQEPVREEARDEEEVAVNSQPSELIKSPVSQTETTFVTDRSTATTVTESKTKTEARTETEVATTELPATTTEPATASLRNETETLAPTPSSEVVQVVDNSIDSEPATPTERTVNIKSIHHQEPQFPTLFRNPSLLEAPVSLPVAFYHPYRLFNSHVRHIPVLGRGPPGPITFF